MLMNLLISLKHYLKKAITRWLNNALVKDVQINKNLKRKQVMTDESNFHTPLELCLRLQYRTNRKVIHKTDFSKKKNEKTIDPINDTISDLQKSVTIDSECNPMREKPMHNP